MTPRGLLAHLENIILREAANPTAIRANQPTDCRDALTKNIIAAKALLDDVLENIKHID